MSDFDQDDLPKVDELSALKQRADLMGVKYHPSISVEKLRDKINAALTDTKEPEDAPEEVKAQEETEAQRRLRLKNEANKLVRVNVVCMNPAKSDWKGEIFTVGNSVVGTFKKFVPFGTTDGWHIPQIIYEMIKARECTTFYTEKSARGVDVTRVRLMREFNIEVLPDLTENELKELARRQAMAAGQTA